jgi:hypothetical protein
VISSSELDPIPADRPPVKLLKYDPAILSGRGFSGSEGMDQGKP